ncbi:MAG: LysM peptidoglycan-binding domain-containing protein [Candidatus Riflebacteria bacterium]|nr:LysM peptidoglycan-binding domain-containing protein [Candidatus Riflebacteria bacterium]
MKKMTLVALAVACAPLAVWANPAAFSDTDKKVETTAIKSGSTARPHVSGLSNSGDSVVIPSGNDKADKTAETSPKKEVQPVDSTKKPAEPEKASAPKEPAKPATTGYKVVAGDNLTKIAAKYGVTWQELVELNKKKYPSLAKNPNLIYPGWELAVPDKSAKASAPSDSSTSKPGTDSKANSASAPGAKSDSKAGDQSAKPGDPAKTPVKPAVVDLTTEQKTAHLQDAMDKFTKDNPAPTPAGIPIELDPTKMKGLVDRGILTQEELQALNPPAGYHWVMNNGKVELTKGSSSITSNPAEAPKPTTQTPSTPAPKPAPTPAPAPKPAADTKAKSDTEKAVERNYLAGLPSGMPNILPQMDSAYYNAMDKAIGLMPGGWVTPSPLQIFRGGALDLFTLQATLHAANALYIEKVQENDTNSGILYGNSIDTAKKQVEDARAALQKAYDEFKPLYNQLKAQAKVAQDKLNGSAAESKQLASDLAQLKAAGRLEDSDKITAIITRQKAIEKDNKEFQNQVELFKPLNQLFG